MKKIRFIGIVLFLLGALVQPCVAQRTAAEAEKYVSKMSEAELREKLIYEKGRQAQNARLYKSSGSGWEGNYQAAAGKAGYEDATVIINAIEKRLRDIDAKKAKEDAAQKAKEQKQQGTHQEGDDLEQQSQKEFNEAYQKNLDEKKGMYEHLNKMADANAKAAREGNVATDGLLTRAYMPGSKPISSNMLDKPLGGSTAQQGKSPSQDISQKFGKKKNDEDDVKKKMAELRRMLDALRKNIDELPVEE